MDSGFDLDSFLQQYKCTLILALFGFILLGIGLLTIKKLSSTEDEVEISGIAGESIKESLLVIDIAGAVIKPGVYELPFGSRINDLLIVAGGLSATADREWVAKNLNLAQKLSDGAKIYIPKTGEANSSNSADPSYLQTKLNINTATIPELDTLWGIGEATARKIVDGRPYQKIEELVNKGIVNTGVFGRIKDKISVYQ